MFRKKIIICLGCFAVVNNIFAQSDSFTDEELWYLQKETWIVLALVSLLLLLALYLKFKPKRTRIEKPGSNRTSQSAAELDQTSGAELNEKST